MLFQITPYNRLFSATAVVIIITTMTSSMLVPRTYFIQKSVTTNHVLWRSNKFYGRWSDFWSTLWLTVSLAHWIKIELIRYCNKSSAEMFYNFVSVTYYSHVTTTLSFLTSAKLLSVNISISHYLLAADAAVTDIQVMNLIKSSAPHCLVTMAPRVQLLPATSDQA